MFRIILLLLLPCSIFSQTAKELHASGHEALENKKPEEAIKLFEKAIKLDHSYTLAYYNRGVAHMRINAYQKAEKDFLKTLKLPTSESLRTKACLNLAIIYRSKFNLPEIALKYSSIAIIHEPSSWNPHYSHGLSLNALNRFEEAVQSFDIAISIDPNNPDTYFDRGCVHRKLGNYQESIRDNTKAIELDPKYSSAYNNRGYTNTLMENFNDAVIDYDQAIKIDGSAFSYNNRGFAKYKMGDLKGAELDCEKSISIDPNNSWAYHYLGLINFEMGRTKKACKLFHIALEMGKEDVVLDINSKCKKM